MENTFGFHIFFVLKHMKDKKKITKLKKQKQFLENTKIMFYMFLKTVFKNIFQKQEPNIPLVFHNSQINVIVLIKYDFI